MMKKVSIESYVLTELKKELQEEEVSDMKLFLRGELESTERIKEKEHLKEILIENNAKEADFLVLELMLLGLGRNRICNALSNFSVDRGNVEKVRDLCDLRHNGTKRTNERYVTALKWKSKKRRDHKEMISKEVWNEIKKEYLSGESPVNIGKKYGFSGHIISQRLREEGVFDDLRSTLTKNKIAESKLDSVDDNFFVQLMDEYKTEPTYNIWRIAQTKYPWLLRRQFFDKIKDLGLERTEEEVINLKTEKSKVSLDNSFTIKQYIVEAVNELFESVEKMTEKYLNDELGSYSEIAQFVNKKNKRKIIVTERQIYRLISNNANFRRTKSIEQDTLYKEIVRAFPELDILEEVKFSNNNKKVDIFIPELNLAIDYNGDYWHSDSILMDNSKVTAFFHHKERVETLKDEGVKLIFIWSSDWVKKKEEILNLIKNKRWDDELLNQYESPYNNKGIVSLHKKLVQEQIEKLLKDAGYSNNVKMNGDKMEIDFSTI